MGSDYICRMSLFWGSYACNYLDLPNRLRPTASEPVYMGGTAGNEALLRNAQVVDKSQQAGQLKLLLDTYKEW